MEEPDIIGLGSYGCVVRPKMLCKEDKDETTTNDMVSKIQSEKQTDEDYKTIEFLQSIPDIQNIQNYIVKTMGTCKPKKNEINKKLIKVCAGVINTDIDESYDAYITDDNARLTQMEYGENVDDVVQDIDFWKSIYNLLEGIKVFRENNIMHGDIKKYNIIYLESEKKMKFIDFGFTRMFDDYIKAFMDVYNNLKDDETDDSTDYEVDEINDDYFEEQTDSSPYFPKEYFMLDENAISKKSTFLKYLRIEHDNYGSGIESPRDRVEQFLRESSKTSDTHQMAYFLKTMFNNTNKFDSYLEDSIVKRNSDIDELIEIYNKLLQTKTQELQKKGGKRKNRGIRKSKNTKKKTRKRHRKSKRRQRRK